MHGGATTPQDIVVHARQIIMYQRVGMHKLNGGGSEILRVLAFGV
jgi:hypothetical protein